MMPTDPILVGASSMRRRGVLAVFVATLIGTVCQHFLPAAAQQERVYQSARAASGKEARIALFGRANAKECKTLLVPEIRVVDPPKHGVLVIRTATVTTNRYQSCGALRIPAQVLFYRSRTGYVGPDSISFIVTFENGMSQEHSIAITVVKDGEATEPQEL
jgi:hypothetical protein